MQLLLGARAGISLCVAVLVCSCSCKGVPRDFFLKPPDQRYAQFGEYDFETQYRIYICGQQHAEPPDLGLVAPFAREGSRIVQPLKLKLEGTDDDETVRDIVYVFKEMNRLGTYDVAGDKALMGELREKTTAIRDPTWRQIAEERFQAIRTKSSKP